MTIHYVYIVVCEITNKIYIGKSSNPLRRFNSHMSEAQRGLHNNYFHNSIRKYGSHNFSMGVLYCTKSEEDAYEKEKLFIKQYNSLSPQGYNSVSGGKGGCSNPCKETRIKMSEAKKDFTPWNKGKILVLRNSFNVHSKKMNERTKLTIKAKQFDEYILNWYIKNRRNI